MPLLDTLRAFLTPLPAYDPDPYNRAVILDEGSERALTYQAAFRTDIEDWQRGNTTSGETVNVETALQTIAVQAAIRLLSNDIGSLPVDAYRSLDEGKKELTKPSWVISPNPSNPNETWEDHIKQVVFGVLSDGNSFTRCFPSVTDAQLLTTYDPRHVEIHTDNLTTTYDVRDVGRLTPNEIIHIPWLRPPGKQRGLDPIAAAREGLGVALAADKYVGSYFGNGAVLSGVIEVPPGVTLNETQINDLKEDFKRKHVGARKSHAIGALTGGAKYVPFDVNNRDAQLLELRDSIVEDVARLFGIPPHMLGSQKPGAVAYASVEQRSIDYVTHAILPIVRRIESGYSRLLRGQRTYLRFNVRGLLRADENARSVYYTALLQNKVIRRDEVRALEDLPVDPDAAGYLETPNNNAPDTNAAPPQELPA